MIRSGQDKPNSSGRIRLLAGVGLLVAAASVVYRPSLHGEFILDDDLYLTDNQAITAPGGLLQIWTAKQEHDYYPVSTSSLWLEWRLWGAHSTGYHLTNVVLHIGTAILVWRLLWILAVPGAFFAGLLFAVHPVNVESVAWIAQRKDMLAAAFFLMSILCYLRDEDNRASKEQPNTEQQGNSFWMAGRWYWLSLLVFILALFSKGTATVLPLALAWVLWWRRPLRWSDVARLAPFVVLGGLLVLVNIWFQTYGLSQEIRTVTFTQRFLGAAAAVWFYAAKALVPINLLLVYPQWHIQAADIRWWFPLLAAIVFTIILWRQRSDPSARAVMFAWGFFCIALIPVMGFADVGFMQYSLVADHYQHIALIAAVALVSAGMGHLVAAIQRRRKAGSCVAGGCRMRRIGRTDDPSEHCVRRSGNAVQRHVGEKSKLFHDREQFGPGVGRSRAVRPRDSTFQAGDRTEIRLSRGIQQLGHRAGRYAGTAASDRTISEESANQAGLSRSPFQLGTSAGPNRPASRSDGAV